MNINRDHASIAYECAILVSTSRSSGGAFIHTFTFFSPSLVNHQRSNIAAVKVFINNIHMLLLSLSLWNAWSQVVLVNIYQHECCDTSYFNLHTTLPLNLEGTQRETCDLYLLTQSYIQCIICQSLFAQFNRNISLSICSSKFYHEIAVAVSQLGHPTR